VVRLNPEVIKSFKEQLGQKEVKGRTGKQKEDFRENKTQMSFWLPDTLAKDLKLQAVNEGKKLSQVVVERLSK